MIPTRTTERLTSRAPQRDDFATYEAFFASPSAAGADDNAHGNASFEALAGRLGAGPGSVAAHNDQVTEWLCDMEAAA